MNIFIPHTWMQEYCTIKKTATEIAKRASISGPSIERTEKVGGEWTYDTEVTANRIDMYSVVGFAREIAAIFGVPFREVFDAKSLAARLARLVPKKGSSKDRPAYTLKVSIAQDAACRRYCGMVLDHVEVKESPKWLRDRLEMMGVRAINNVVDVTNYVMLEYGQPMHAFDMDKLVSTGRKGGVDLLHKEIVVRSAKAGERMTTLDGEDKILKAGMTVIADAQGPLAIAGIKGGARASIDAGTNTITLEAASFDHVQVRTTSRMLNLRTDASVRFEKNISPEYAPYAIARAAELLKELASAEVVSSLVDVYPQKQVMQTYSFAWSTLDRMTGIAIARKDAIKSLTALGFAVKDGKDAARITPPFWRQHEIEGEADFVEEVVRMHGYDRLPLHGLSGAIPVRVADPSFAYERATRHFLRDIGWTEVYTYSFLDERSLTRTGMAVESALELYNPLSTDFRYMRPSLLPGLLAVAAEHKQRRDTLSLFELSKVYYSRERDLPEEVMRFAGLLSAAGSVQEVFLQMKGVLEAWIVQWAGVHEVSVVPLTREGGCFVSGASAVIMVGDKEVGVCGLPRPEILAAWGVKADVVMWDIDFDVCLGLMSDGKRYAPPARYPAVLRDVAFVIDTAHPYSKLVTLMRGVSPLVTSVELFDVFAGAKLGAGKQSLAFHIAYSAPDRTLTADEVAGVHEQVVATLQRECGVEIR